MRAEGSPLHALADAGARGYTRLMPTESTMMIVEFIRSIPPGRVVSYGAVAELSGSPAGAAGARQVARILHSMSRSYGLPWWRVVRKDGSIALGDEEGRILQSRLLESEGVEFASPGRIDMGIYGIRP